MTQIDGDGFDAFSSRPLAHVHTELTEMTIDSLCSPTLAKPFIVVLLTLSLTASLTGCSLFAARYAEDCKTRAYVRSDVEEFMKTRYSTTSPVRVAVIPFSVPASLSASEMELPGLGNQLAWRLHGELLKRQLFPIVEVFNRHDWPMKKEEFFTGNFNALRDARDAGYDLALIGHLADPRSLDGWSIYSKLIETESGITLWYGRSDVQSNRTEWRNREAFFWLNDRRPDLIPIEPLIEASARCLVDQIHLESLR
jgi:hypothetical protein